MRTKILFINNSGFSKITAELTFVSYIGKLYPYEIWDLSKMYGKNSVFVNVDEAIDIESVEQFELSLQKQISQYNIIIITNMVQSAYTRIYPYVRELGIPVIDTQKNNFMTFLESRTAFDFSLSLPFFQRVKRMLNSLYLFRKVLKLKRYGRTKFDYLLSAYNFAPEEVQTFVKTHNVKYDEFLKYKDTLSPINHKYILFIDSATCYHPNDYINDNNFDESHHLKQLNDYFELIEKKYNLPVVISLHPCSVGHLSESSFNGRTICYSQTALYIQHCEFVVSFFSTSLINVVLAKKPSLIITSKEIEKSQRKIQEQCAFTMAKMCGFFIDSLDTPKLCKPEMNVKKYEKFTNKYLVNSSRLNTSNAEMAVELIRMLETSLQSNN